MNRFSHRLDRGFSRMNHFTGRHNTDPRVVAILAQQAFNLRGIAHQRHRHCGSGMDCLQCSGDRSLRCVIATHGIDCNSFQSLSSSDPTAVVLLHRCFIHLAAGNRIERNDQEFGSKYRHVPDRAHDLHYPSCTHPTYNLGRGYDLFSSLYRLFELDVNQSC